MRCIVQRVYTCARAYFDTHYKTLTAGKVGVEDAMMRTGENELKCALKREQE